MRRAALVLALAAALPACQGESEPITEEPELRAPEHGPVPPLPYWQEDPPTEAKTELGRALFHDFRLSGSGQTSCDRCHIAATSFQDSLATPVPDSSFPEAQPHLTRNTSSMLNLVFAPVSRWDGSHTDLVEVMVFPFAEGNMDLGQDIPSAQAALKERLTSAVPGYVPLFAGAFGEDIEALEAPAVWRLAGRALLAFIRLASSRDSDFDRWNAGDDGAMSEGAIRGFEIFRGRGRCSSCHTGPLFTDFAFHNVSTSPPSPAGERADEGRFLVTGEETDRGAFLTPTLRSAFATGPYFHDGAAGTLRNAIRHFGSDAVLSDPLRDPIFEPAPELGEADIDDLVEFFRALRGQPIGELVGPPQDMP
jgi:cytochrome c peroxidase